MIEVKNLSKEFKTAKKYPGFKGTVKSLFSNEKIIKKAVEEVSFHINEGDLVGYIGSNGAGKSTTIKMMSGILVPTSGTCYVNGIEPYKQRQKNARQIGVVFGQRTQLWWDLPITETFTVLKEIYGINQKDFEKRMDFINQVLGIKEFENSSVRTLSLGQRMRADLGAALVHNPKVLYLDEPTIGLDVVVKDKIRKAIKEMNREFKTTVILTTHDLVDIEEICNHIMIIDQGKKIYDGDITQLKKEYGSMTRLELEVKDTEVVRKLDLNKLFQLTTDQLSTKLANQTFIVDFDKTLISVSRIAREVMKYTDTSDMRIQETDITEIVKKIYTSGVN